MTAYERIPGRVYDKGFEGLGDSSEDKDTVERQPGRIYDEVIPLPQEEESAPPVSINAGESLRSSSNWVIVGAAFSFMIVASILYSVAVSLQSAWSQNNWGAAALIVVVLFFLLVLSGALWREVQALREVDELTERRDLVAMAVERNDVHALHHSMMKTLDAIRKDRPELIYRFESAAKDRDSCEAIISLYESVVQRELDREADDLITRSAVMVGAVVSAVPHPAMDAAVVLWRALALTRKVGRVYGLQPTGMSSFKLLRYAIMSAFISAGVDKLSDLLLEEGANGVVQKAGAFLAEGSVTAWRTYRLGKRVQKLCRVLPVPA